MTLTQICVTSHSLILPAMSDTDMKFLKFVLRPGVNVTLSTKMPSEEIIRELTTDWPNGLASIDGVDEKGEHNVSYICRADLQWFCVVKPGRIVTKIQGITQ